MSLQHIKQFASTIHFTSMALQFMADQPLLYPTIKAKPLALKAIKLSGDTLDYDDAIQMANWIVNKIRGMEYMK